MKKLSKFAYFSTTFLFFTFTNLYLSNLIFSNIQHGWRFSNAILNIVYVENTGAAFSIMQNSTNILIALSIIALFGIFYYVIKNIKTILMKELFFISFLLAGILGNLYERFFFGYVRDFFDLNFVTFPIFNISDIFINIGVVGMIVLILLTKKTVKSDE